MCVLMKQVTSLILGLPARLLVISIRSLVQARFKFPNCPINLVTTVVIVIKELSLTPQHVKELVLVVCFGIRGCTSIYVNYIIIIYV